MEQNLWGDLYIAKKNLVKSPKKILEEQANIFNTGNKWIVCSVTSSFEDHDVSWLDMKNPFEETEQKEKDLVLKMKLTVPSLNNYSIVILSAKYLVSTIYPCKLKNLITNGEWKEVSSEDSFNEELKAILSSNDVSKLLTNLYSQMDD
mgnify:FL=1|jgi:hypothetical protein